MREKRILSFGEIMLRFSLQDYKLIEQTNTANFMFTGTGVNVLSGLSHFGYDTKILSVVPDNRIGLAAQANIRKLGIDNQTLHMDGHHIGVYFLEMGYGNRPSEVTYLNRLESAFNTFDWASCNIDNMLDDVDVVHICGINLSLTPKVKEFALQLAREANKQNKMVCFDFNYRMQLNSEETFSELHASYQEMLSYSDVVFGGKRDLIELLKLDVEFGTSAFEEIAQLFVQKYDLKAFAGTVRGRENGASILQGFLQTKDAYTTSEKYPIYVYDRIGTGDAFTAGILLGLIEEKDLKYIVDFGTSSAVLSHTTLGDSPLLTKVQVERFMDNPHLDVVR